jgi:KDO2-lipid IV(A) lauroyltransferase
LVPEAAITGHIEVELIDRPEFSLTEPVPRSLTDAGTPRPALIRWIRSYAGEIWLTLLFWNARRNPWFVRRTRPFWMWGAWTFARILRETIDCNARRILGHHASRTERDALVRGIIGSFYDFIADVGRSIGQSQGDLVKRIEKVDGEAAYHAARREGRGAIILTAHMGSFEVGMAALLEHEKRVHVLFRRDSRGLFEQTRSALRRQLGVVEECVDDGLAVWVRLREALAADEVVLIQGDRVMPGQKGQAFPFFNGNLLIPTGPVKLALASGAPIIPIFSVRLPDGRVRLFIEPPIQVNNADDFDPALAAIQSLLEKYVRQFPEQWLMIHRAWREDALL